MTQTTRVFDALAGLSVMLVTFTVLNSGRMPDGLDEFLAVRLSVKNLVLVILFVVIWHTCFALCGLYRRWSKGSVGGIAFAPLRIVLACTLATLILVLFTPASRSGAFDLNVLLYFWVAGVLAELCGRAAIGGAAEYLDRHSRAVRHAVIIGSGPRALALLTHIESRPGRDWVVLGCVDTRPIEEIHEELRPLMIGTLEELEHLLCNRPIEQAFIALPVKSCYQAIQDAVNTCERVGVEPTYFPDIFSSALARREFDEDGELTSVRHHLVPDDYRLVVKRAIDVVGALCGIVLLSPVLLTCAAVIRFTSPGPVLFTQFRYGHNRRQFRMYKFRTMVTNAERLQASLESKNEVQGPVFKIRADPRVTPAGQVMRKLSLDELPQLFNVLRGDMSLVGPRPLPVRDVLRFNEAWLMRRFSVRPGLTCLWQVNGRSETAFDQWVRLDLDYIDNWSLALDMRILIKTVPVVLSGSGAM